MSYIYKAFDKGRNQKMMLKISKIDLDSDGAYKEAMDRLTTSAYAQQMTRHYRRYTAENNYAPPIFYIPSVVYTLITEFKGVVHIYAEPEIDTMDEEWEKYTNNF